MRSDGNAPKNGEPTVGFSFTTMLKQNGRVLVKDFLAKNSMMILGHPPYSPDLIPANFYLFACLKSALKKWRFAMLLTSLRMRRKS
jgi:transposase